MGIADVEGAASRRKPESRSSKWARSVLRVRCFGFRAFPLKFLAHGHFFGTLLPPRMGVGVV